MKSKAICLILLAAVSLVASARNLRADRSASIPIERVVTTEPGVIPAGTQLVIQCNDTVSTSRSLGDANYAASLAADIMDQNGMLLIPKESPVNLGVFSFGYIGPGGAGMSELVLGVRDVTVSGVSYPAGTAQPQRNGGLGPTEHTTKWIGGAGEPGRVLTRGSRIYVPSGAILSFQIIYPIRLKGYQR
jgi:hypothetical protein